MADLFVPEITPEIRAAVIAELRAKVDEFTAAGRNAFPGICCVMYSGGDPQPVGLYSEEKTLEKVRAIFTRMLDAAEGVKLFQPCNGTAGEMFMADWCARCTKDNLNPVTGEGDGCEIIASTMALDIDDEDYPREWRQDGPEGPRCTAFEERRDV